MDLLRLELTWPQLMGLHQLYEEGGTRLKIMKHPFIRRLKTDKKLLQFKSNNLDVIEALPRYQEYYQRELLPAHVRYRDFLLRTGIESDGKRPYTTYDLETLLYIEKQLDVLKSSLTTERQFSAQLFKGSKYLHNNQSVLKAVLKLLGLTAFPEQELKEQQWRLVVDCPDPKLIVLCENLAALKRPDVARSRGLELWYVGGNNIGILQYLAADHLRLPVCYMCDWDYAGLQIYGRVKKLLTEKGAAVKLLQPYDLTMKLPVDSDYHSSNWVGEEELSGLNKADFTAEAIILIRSLIRDKAWIEEESQDLEALLHHNGLL